MAAAAVALVVAAPAAAMTAGAGRTLAVRRLDFVWPAEGTVTTPFTHHHPGLDIGLLRSLHVLAAAPGRVVDVGYTQGFEGYGKIVLVEVTPNVVTLYAHLAKPRVHPGDVVRRDQLLGIAGCTGMCTGVHLHFEVRRDGRAVNPLRYLQRRIADRRWIATAAPARP